MSNSSIIKLLIVLFIVVPLLCIGIFYIWFFYGVSQIDTGNRTDKIIKKEVENAGIGERLTLADILNTDNEILITEDNIDNTNNIILKKNLKKGIYITQESRDMVQKLFNEVFGEKTFYIDKWGYLKFENLTTNDNLSNKIKAYIENDERLLVIKISDTYKSIQDDGAILDIMIEKDVYTRNIKYSDSIDISIINSYKINNIVDEDLSLKEIYEEIIINIFSE